MARNFMQSALAAALAMSATYAFAGSVTLRIPVAADAAVNAANPDANLNTLTTRGGLFSGLDTVGSDYRFYLKFNLPAFTQGSAVTAATLTGTYTDAFSGTHSFHGVSLTSDAWDESTITYSNAPTATWETFGGFETAGITPPATVSLASMLTTSVVDTEYRGDGVLSLLVSTIDGRFGDLAYFGSKEYDPRQAFTLDVTVSTPNAVPVPVGVSTGGITLMTLFALHVARKSKPAA